MPSSPQLPARDATVNIHEFHKSDFTISITRVLARGPTLSEAGTVLFSFGGYTGEIPDQGTGQKTPVLVGGKYEDSASGNLFQLGSYAGNTGTRPTVAVFGEGEGSHVWGGNFVAYTKGSGAAIGTEVDFGNLNTEGGTAYGVVVVNTGQPTGAPVNQGSYIQIQSNSEHDRSRYGMKFQGGTNQPLDPATGIAIYFDSIEAEFGLNFGSGCVFEGAAIVFGNGHNIQLGTGSGTKLGISTSEKLGFWNATPIAQPTVTGTFSGTALKSLLEQLALAGLIKNEATEE
jgi:hypothetical protein